ncbi:hypothetical protein [Deinococcus planocerae]|uniref:hypothetical protein n=1 Tax=Deinococcus planocerae TaxID=1737569 RepID=UPI0011AEF244|nr:hypothetical protein [Deinococcus planocerae]
MDLEKAISAVERFFLDIIGNIIPGGVLLIGIIHLFNPSILPYYALNINISSATWLCIVTIMYVLGYATSSFSKVIIRLLKLSGNLRKKFDDKEIAKKIFLRSKIRALASRLEIEAEDSAGMFRLRNYILSRVSTEDNYLTRRFRFISLLNIGLASSLLIVMLLTALCTVISIILDRTLIYPFSTIIYIGMALLIVAFIDRFIEFHIRTLELPFSVWDVP